MITYPECQACDCKADITIGANNNYQSVPSGALTYLSYSNLYTTKLEEYFNTYPEDDISTISTSVAQALGGNPTLLSNININKLSWWERFKYAWKFANK